MTTQLPEEQNRFNESAPIADSQPIYYQPPANYSYAAMPQGQYGYNSYNYYPQLRRGPHPVIAVGFWIFYALVGFWVEFSLAISLWVCAIVLPFTLPLAFLRRNNWLPNHVVYSSDSWFALQSDTVIYSLATATSLVGILLLVIAIMTVKPLFRLHRFIFRELGGLRI